MSKYAYPKWRRQRQVIAYLELMTEKESTFVATIAKIARALGMRPSQHLRNIVNEMVDVEQLSYSDTELSKAAPYRREYFLPQVSYFRIRSARQIALTVNGKPQKPLPMFPESG